MFGEFIHGVVQDQLFQSGELQGLVAKPEHPTFLIDLQVANPNKPADKTIAHTVAGV